MQKRLDLFNSHTNLVYAVMRKHHIIRGHTYFEDISQDAFAALWKATETFDEKKGKFVTHGFWYVRESVQRSLDRIPIIYLGRYRAMLKRIKKCRFHSLNFIYSDGEKETLNLLNLLPDEGLKIQEEQEENEYKLSMIKDALQNINLTEEEKNELSYFLETGRKGRIIGKKSRQYNNWTLRSVINKIQKWIKRHEYII